MKVKSLSRVRLLATPWTVMDTKADQLLFNRKILGKWLVKIINLAKSRKDLGFSSLNITPTCIKSPVTVMMMHGGYIIP